MLTLASATHTNDDAPCFVLVANICCCCILGSQSCRVRMSCHRTASYLYSGNGVWALVTTKARRLQKHINWVATVRDKCVHTRASPGWREWWRSLHVCVNISSHYQWPCVWHANSSLLFCVPEMDEHRGESSTSPLGAVAPPLPPVSSPHPQKH